MSNPSHIEQLIHRLRDAQAQAKLVGTASSFLQAIAQFPAIAKSDAAVLVSGETGTGKELVARAMHYMSERAPFPFVAVNCGALPDTLLEDELFGHERGAFTDAHLRRLGLIVQAEKGTLFLDEIDTLTVKAQVALLRVVQDKKFRPVGTSYEQQADVRIVAATNTALHQLVQASTFRADLYYRLCVFSVQLPPLRERVEDISLLASHFLKKHATTGRGSLTLTSEAHRALLSYTWPGNVRELENAIIRGIHLSEGREDVGVGDLGLLLPASVRRENSREDLVVGPSYKSSKRQAIELFERTYLTQLMLQCQGNVSRAARAAGKERRDLGKLLKKYQIDPQAFRLCP